MLEKAVLSPRPVSRDWDKSYGVSGRPGPGKGKIRCPQVSHHLLPRHGARAHRARERVDRRRRRQIDAIAFEACDALLLGAGPGLIPRDVAVVRDVVAVAAVDAALASRAVEQA